MKDASQEKRRIVTAVVTGGHAYDVPAFLTLFRSIPEIDFYPQHLDNFVADEGNARQGYDVVVFYNMHMTVPGADQEWWEGGIRQALEQLGETDQGLLVMHHALLAFPQWQPWSDICGIQERSTHVPGFDSYANQTVRVEIANRQHPITQGLEAWEIVDETYVMPSAGEDSDILLTTSHPRSIGTLGWARQHRKARVFCLALGHGREAFKNPVFRTVIGRGIQWLARRI